MTASRQMLQVGPRTRSSQLKELLPAGLASMALGRPAGTGFAVAPARSAGVGRNASAVGHAVRQRGRGGTSGIG